MTYRAQTSKLTKKTTASLALVAITTLLVGACSMEPECAAAPAIPEGASPNISIMTYNVGNDDTKDDHYALRLKDQSYEDFMAARIRELSPDIIALQEVLPERTCRSFDESDDTRTCFDIDHRAAPAKRILGDDYTVVCDSRESIECIGVHVDFGTIRGVRAGAFDSDGAETAELPYKACIYPDCDASADVCDGESTVSTVIVDTSAGPIRVVHVHPTAIGNKCRQHQVRQAFELADELDTVILGDWNFDTDREHYVAETSIWGEHVGEDRRFADHTPRNSSCRAPSTISGKRLNLDRVVTDFAMGECAIFNHPDLDEDFDLDGADFRPIDHKAVLCDLYREE